MSVTAILSPSGEQQREYLPGFGPDDLALDPVLRALTGKRIPENAVRASLGLAPVPRRKQGESQPVTPPTTLLAAYRNVKGDFYPDAVVDTKAKRERDMVPVLARLEKLATLYPAGLKFYRFTLSDLGDTCLYDPATVKAAKRIVRRWLRSRGLRGELKVERGRRGGIHVHVVTCASADAGGKDVYDLAGLASYLVKPADARACMPKRDEKLSAAELRYQKDQAAEDWLRADAMLKAGKFGKRSKLPRMFAPCS